MIATDRHTWQYTPGLPLRSAPFLHWPIRPRELAVHLARTWRPLGSRVFLLAAAFVVWRWFSPSAADAATFQIGWIAQIWVRNLALLLVVAGGSHVLLYTLRVQGDDLRYDRRPLGKRKRIFLFNDQVLDNMFLTLASASVVATAWESLGWWAYTNGVFGSISFADHPIWFVVIIVCIPIWSANYFAVGHWLLHRPAAYRHVHSWHHRNVNVGPWSGLAMHPAEHVVLYGDLAILLLVPTAPFHMIFAIMHHTLGAPLSHTGYDAIVLPGGLRMEVGDFHHQLHHRFIECNYGGIESPLDDWAASLHDGTPDGDRLIAARRRSLSAARTAAS